MTRANVNIKLDIPDKTKRILLTEIGAKYIPKIEKQVIQNVYDPIVDNMLEVLRSDPIYRGIAGDYTAQRKDLMAQFGLTPELSEESLHIIEKIFKQSIKVQRRSDKLGLRVIANYNDIENKLLSHQVFSYMSYKLNGDDSGYLIPWMKWILDKQGEANAFISFDSTGVELGRSKRAIMIPTPGIHWTVENNVDLGEGNFIQRILNSNIFINKSRDIIVEEYKRQINV